MCMGPRICAIMGIPIGSPILTSVTNGILMCEKDMRIYLLQDIALNDTGAFFGTFGTYIFC